MKEIIRDLFMSRLETGPCKSETVAATILYRQFVYYYQDFESTIPEKLANFLTDKAENKKKGI